MKKTILLMSMLATLTSHAGIFDYFSKADNVISSQEEIVQILANEGAHELLDKKYLGYTVERFVAQGGSVYVECHNDGEKSLNELDADLAGQCAEDIAKAIYENIYGKESSYLSAQHSAFKGIVTVR